MAFLFGVVSREICTVAVNNAPFAGHIFVPIWDSGWGLIAVEGSAGREAADSDPLADLHREMAETLRRVAWAMLRDWSLAEDAVQEAFVLFAVKADEIPVEHRRGWLVRTVQLTAFNLRRTRERQGKLLREQSEQYRQTVFAATDAPMAATISAEDCEQLRQAMLELPDSQRQVLRRRLYDDKTFQEIADELGITLGTALSRMRLAIEKLRKNLT